MCTFPGSKVALILQEDLFNWKLISRAISVNPYWMSESKVAGGRAILTIIPLCHLEQRKLRTCNLIGIPYKSSRKRS